MEINRDEFRRYLIENEATEFLAVAACACPLARFLNRDSDVPVYTVTRSYFRGPNGERKTPMWAYWFVFRVDKDHSAGDIVTGAEALKVLDSVDGEE